MGTVANPKTLARQKQEAFERAVDHLARYQFMMFGYWAAIWIHLNTLDDLKETCPFHEIVDTARAVQAKVRDPGSPE